MDLVLKIKKCVFENEDKEKVEFYALSTEIDGEKIDLQVKDDSKKLFKYLVKFHKFNEKGDMID